MISGRISVGGSDQWEDLSEPCQNANPRCYLFQTCLIAKGATRQGQSPGVALPRPVRGYAASPWVANHWYYRRCMPWHMT